MPVRSSISNAVIAPSRLTPILPLQRWSRAWMSVFKTFDPVGDKLYTGRRSSFDSA